MRLPRFRTILLVVLAAAVSLYTLAAILIAANPPQALAKAPHAKQPLKIAIFGASGTAGSGILKAALASDDIANILIVTRRDTPLIANALNSQKAERIFHQDYLDYSAIESRLSDLDAVYWAIGISSLGADEKTYAMIHVDFPLQFVKTWAAASRLPKTSFHFISSSDIAEDSDTMWVRQKIRAEKALFEFAEQSAMRVVAYRPDYIGAIEEEAEIQHQLLYNFFKPVGAAVKAVQIGQAMIDVTLRGEQIPHRYKPSTRKIVQHSNSYVDRTGE